MSMMNEEEKRAMPAELVRTFREIARNFRQRLTRVAGVDGQILPIRDGKGIVIKQSDHEETYPVGMIHQEVHVPRDIRRMRGRRLY